MTLWRYVLPICCRPFRLAVSRQPQPFQGEFFAFIKSLAGAIVESDVRIEACKVCGGIRCMGTYRCFRWCNFGADGVLVFLEYRPGPQTSFILQ